MDRDVQDMVAEINEIGAELDRTQKEIVGNIVRSISRIQELVKETVPVPKREVILEKARVIIRDDGNTVFDKLF